MYNIENSSLTINKETTKTTITYIFIIHLKLILSQAITNSSFIEVISQPIKPFKDGSMGGVTNSVCFVIPLQIDQETDLTAVADSYSSSSATQFIWHISPEAMFYSGGSSSSSSSSCSFILSIQPAGAQGCDTVGDTLALGYRCSQIISQRNSDKLISVAVAYCYSLALRKGSTASLQVQSRTCGIMRYSSMLYYVSKQGLVLHSIRQSFRSSSNIKSKPINSNPLQSQRISPIKFGPAASNTSLMLCFIQGNTVSLKSTFFSFRSNVRKSSQEILFPFSNFP